MKLKIRKLGECVKKYREQKDMTQVELAKELDVTVQFVCNFEKGISSPSNSILKKICKTLSIPKSVFVNSVISEVEEELSKILK